MPWIVHALQPTLLMISSVYLTVIVCYFMGITPAPPSVKNYSYVALFGFLAGIVNFVNYIWIATPNKWLNCLFTLLLSAAVIVYPIYVFYFLIPAIKDCKKGDKIVDAGQFYDSANSMTMLEQFWADQTAKAPRKGDEIEVIEPGMNDCSLYGDLLMEPLHFGLQLVHFIICLLCLVTHVYYNLFDASNSNSCFGYGATGPNVASKTEILAVKREV
ncbi:hypothetical protein GZH46_00080 [Fragariocoptes setiger]|uniref:Uncharacterized protein n=1 Tax=Fragariocoptes setiger TaxID=1670756 RepID=A0ABQ7SD47_9ACAR|nr:hypothetical protein GZH46_00080 [Fragariocoptes setiger]